MLEGISKFVFQVTGIKAEHQTLFFRALWVIIVSIHIAWVCGWLVSFGFAAPFASASDMADLKEAAKISAGLQMKVEIRDQKRLLCTLPENQRGITQRVIDKLVQDYERVTGKPFNESLVCEPDEGI